jgi:general secretion pathway protein C
LPAHPLNDHWLQLQLQRQLAPLWQPLAALGERRWRQILLLLALLWLLAAMARLVWLLVPAGGAELPLAAPANVAPGGAAQMAAVDIEAMAGWHLFGEAGVAPSTPTPTPKPVAAGIEAQAQASALNLRLQGVMSATDPALARALILADGRQQQFAIGDTLPANGRVTLAKVLPDRAIIDNNGRYEALWLYDPAVPPASTTTAPAAAAQSAGSVDLRGDDEVTAMAQEYRQRLIESPASLAEVIQVAAAHEDDRLIGYRVSPGPDADRFLRFGFRPGDVITAINGIDLTDPQQALELYGLIGSANDATFDVRRGSEELTLMVSLQEH